MKTCLNSEHNAFKKAVRQATLDPYEEANESSFFQFTHDGDALLNKDENQRFGMQFEGTKFRHNDEILLSFRKTFSYEADKLAELVEETCNEYF